MVKREIEFTDRQIDALVYALYGLTEKEIRLWKGNKKELVWLIPNSRFRQSGVVSSHPPVGNAEPLGV